MKQKIIVANWKMNPQSKKEATALFNGIKILTKNLKKTQIIVCPPALYLAQGAELSGAPKTKKTYSLGGQNFFYEQKGSFTGEISASMLRDMGAKYAIIGHSERRKAGETDEDIQKKVIMALKSDVRPIICIGETTRDEDGEYLTFLQEQLQEALRGVAKSQLSHIIIAYEPVWAIGAREAMKPELIHEMMIFVRKILIDMFKIKDLNVPVLYGGAVDETNIADIVRYGNSHGILVGRQSLALPQFREIAKAVDAKII
jgi:triosephosphate isomerase